MPILFLCLLALPISAHAYAPALEVPMDGVLDATGGLTPLEVRGTPGFVAGKFGQAVELNPGAAVFYGARGILDKGQGTLSFWLRPNWSGDDGASHGLVADQADYSNKALNTFYLWKDEQGLLRFDLATPLGHDLSADVRLWQAGEWHHVAVTWASQTGLALYVDGRCVARRITPYEPVAWPRLVLGGDFGGNGTANAAFDEVRLYTRPLETAHIMALMANLPLEDAAVTALKAPSALTLGKPFEVQLQITGRGILTRDYPIVLALAGLPFATVQMALQGRELAPDKVLDLPAFAVTVPDYLRLRSGAYPLSAYLEGTVPLAGVTTASSAVALTSGVPERAGHTYSITADGVPMRDRRRFISSEPQEGFVYAGKFYRDNTEGRALACRLIQTGDIAEALPCRLVDSVEATATDHNFTQWGESVVRELLPGVSCRLTGKPDTVTQQVTIAGIAQRSLPAFAYTLATTPRPVPHLLVAEIPHDADRVTAFAIDAAPGSTVSLPLAASGSGDTRLLGLSTVYTGAEGPPSRRLIHHVMLFYPKSAAAVVTVSPGGQEGVAAVARLAVYELLDNGAALHNTVMLPEEEPVRSVTLNLPEHSFLFSQFGFAGSDALQRRASLGNVADYLGFVGINRLEFSPLGFAMNAHYYGSRLINISGYDLFDELLPLVDTWGLELVPVLPPLSNFDKLPEFSDDSFQLDRDGKTYRQAYGRVPDPLRPEVQAQAMGFVSEFLERIRGRRGVSAVALRVDGQAGTCYTGDAPNRPPEAAGYSEWALTAFQQATGVQVGGTEGDAPSRYAWLRANPEAWDRWISWRCEATRAFWLKLRDLVVSRGDGRKLLLQTTLPSPNSDPAVTAVDKLRYHGYDPRLFLAEAGLRLSRGVDMPLPGSESVLPMMEETYRTAEGTEIELRFADWALSNHPTGHRVGPISPTGRALLAPLVHALRIDNAFNLTLSNWYPATLGHEIALRRFIRAYRALPAVEATDFEGHVSPRKPEVVVQRYGQKRLGIINDGPAPQRVRLTFSRVLPFGTRIVNLASGLELAQTVGRATTRVEVSLEAWDLVALEIREMPSSGDIKPRPGQSE